MIRSVADYPFPQAAFDAASPGDAIYFPGIRQYVAPVGGWKITKNLEIYGDGPTDTWSGLGSVLKPSADPPPPGGANHVLVFDSPGNDLDNVSIHDLCIMGGGSGGDGIHHTTGPTSKLSQLRIHRVAIVEMAGAGISLIGQAEVSGNVVGVFITDCQVRGCGLQGVVMGWGFQVLVETTRLIGNGREGISATDTEIVATMCGFDANCASGGVAQFSIVRGPLARVDASRFSAFGSALPALQLLQCPGSGQVGGCVFDLGTHQANSVGIDIGFSLTANAAILVLPNRFIGVDTAVRVHDTAVTCVVLPQSCSGAGSQPIQLPSSASNSATLAIPSPTDAASSRISGLLLPALPGNPDSSVQGGVLARVGGELRVRLANDPPGIFKKLKRTSPPLVSELSFGTVAGKTSLTVHWVAPTEPSWTGPVAEYEIRYATFPLNESNFYSGTKLVPSPTPLAPDSAQCARLTGLASCTVYYAAIKTKDHSEQWSAAVATAAGKQTRCTGSIETDCEEA